MERCCKHPVHAQIEYSGNEGAVESLIGVGEKGITKAEVKMLHDMLDEWITKRHLGHGIADHFIVYSKWPGQ